MRQAQSNRRGRGRSRKAQNPLTKNYESNGPDVKIRGTAAHISEKYTSLARDAQTSGDTVRQENYFQHAEHYNRIIAAAQQNNQSSAEKSDEQTNSEADQGASDDGEQQQASGNAGKNRDGGRRNSRRRRSENRAQKANGDDKSAEMNEAQAGETEGQAEVKTQKRGRRRAEPQVEVVSNDDIDAPVTETTPTETVIVENNTDDAAA